MRHLHLPWAGRTSIRCRQTKEGVPTITSQNKDVELIMAVLQSLLVVLLLSLLQLSSGTPSSSGYETKWYNQTLDHVNNFDPTLPQWQQRYLINATYFEEKRNNNNENNTMLTKDCPGPILLYTGNEGDITGFWSSNGFMIDVLAPKWGALLLFPEQRYYGESIPLSSSTSKTPNYEYLSTQQVLEDYVSILNAVKREYNAESCPTIAFGGSYGGTLTTFMRVAYPHSIIGGLASSAPIGYYDVEGWESHGIDEFTFSDIVTSNYGNVHNCLEAISLAKKSIDGTDDKTLAQEFHLCSVDGLGPKKTDLFLYGLEGLCQQNYPYKIGKMPAWPVTKVCDILVEAYDEIISDGRNIGNIDESAEDKNREKMVAAAAKASFISLSFDPLDGCFQTLEEGPGNIVGDGPGLTAWGYQSCTEELHEFSSRGIRDYIFDMKTMAIDVCEQTYSKHVAPNPTAYTDRYGGYLLGDGKVDGVTNIIWSNGDIDPWSGGGFKPEYAPKNAAERGLYYFMMKKAAHHLDLRGPNVDDLEEVVQVRLKEERIMWGWIQEYVKVIGNNNDNV